MTQAVKVEWWGPQHGFLRSLTKHSLTQHHNNDSLWWWWSGFTNHWQKVQITWSQYGLAFSFKLTYGSVCAGREKWPFNVIFFLKIEPPCDQTWWDSPVFPIVSCLSYVLHAKNTLVGPVGPFQSTLILTVFTPDRRFLAMFEVGIDDCNCN